MPLVLKLQGYRKFFVNGILEIHGILNMPQVFNIPRFSMREFDKAILKGFSIYLRF